MPPPARRPSRISLLVFLAGWRLACVAFAVLVASLAIATPTGAYRDCCFAGSLPPMVSGFHLWAATAEEAHDQAIRLGFQPIWKPGEGEIRAGLDRGFLWWQPTYRPHDFAGIPAPGGFPSLMGPMYLLCHPVIIPNRPAFSVPGASHPNGALAVTGALAVVADLDRACAELPGLLPRDPRWRASFEPPRVLAALGAFSRTATTSDGTTITLLSPNGPEGIVARWLAASGPRWLGVTVRVADLHRTARVLARHRMDSEALVIQGLQHLLVELHGPGGAIIAFFELDSPGNRDLP